jgi:hypothetical protein
MKNWLPQSIILCWALLGVGGVHANNLQITNVTVPNDSTITFNISWENNWRPTSNECDSYK